MTQDDSDILHSAFLDGEVTPVERAALEKTLASSAEARRVQREFQALGDHLRALPEETVPDEFAASVMAMAERASLLLEPASADSPQPKPGRSWVVALGSLFTTAAVLLLMTKALTTSGTEEINEEQSRSLSETGKSASLSGAPLALKTGPKERFEAAAAPAGEPLEKRFFKSSAGLSGSGTDPRNESFRRRTAHKPSGFRGKSAAKKFPLNLQNGAGVAKAKRRLPGPSTDLSKQFKKGDAKAGKGGRRFSPATPAIGSRLLTRSRGGVFRIGDVVPYLEVSGNRTVVIEVIVVDVRDAVGKVQLLLARHSIPEVAKTLVGRDNRPGKNKVAQPDRGNLIAVYVETTQSQFTSAINELAGSYQIALKPPLPSDRILLAAMDPLRDRFTSNRQKFGKKAQSQKLATLADAITLGRIRRSQVKKLVAASPQKNAFAKDGKKRRIARAAAPGNSARSKPEGRGKSIAANRTRPPQSFTKRKSSAAKNSFHFRVTLPQLPRLPQTPLRTAQLKGRPNGKQQRGGRSLQSSKPRDDALRRKILASAVPIRVIFIFRRQRAAP